ncbi:hypothetical protein NQ318_023428, partial [Aromia moschata]
CVNKPTRKPLTLSVKLDIIYKLRNGYSNARICREYALSMSTVSCIWNKREKYLGAQTQTNPNVKKIRQPERKEVDNALLKWFTLKRRQNVPPLSGPILQEKAAQLAQLQGATDEQFYLHKDGKMHGEAAAVSPEITDDWLKTVGPNVYILTKTSLTAMKQSPICFKNDPRLPVTYEANKTSWMTGDLFSKLLQVWYQELSKDKR